MNKIFGLLCVLALSTSVMASNKIIMRGTGQATGKPDAALVSLGVVTQHKIVTEALQKNNQSVSAVLKIVKDYGVNDDDVKTSALNIRQEYGNDKNGKTVPGDFVVSNQIAVLVYKFDKLGNIINDIIKSGANRIDGISFLCTSKETLLDKARKAAIANALHKAKLYANAAGVTLDAVVSIVEYDSQVNGPPRMMLESRMEAGNVPIAAGQNTFTVTVTMEWTILNNQKHTKPNK